MSITFVDVVRVMEGSEREVPRCTKSTNTSERSSDQSMIPN